LQGVAVGFPTGITSWGCLLCVLAALPLGPAVINVAAMEDLTEFPTTGMTVTCGHDVRGCLPWVSAPV